ncbi:gliding motility-associated C-terminal domain-containing protein [Crocinitomix catalasitica]|nr:gliding motility-associated C-terminal domain-containing protein [Crocinitomix catalasitica]
MKFLTLTFFLISIGAFAQENHPVANHPDNDSLVFFMANICTPDCDWHPCYKLRPTFAATSKISNYKFKVYNRWGQVIFESTVPKEFFPCMDFDDGSYVWSLKFNLDDEEESRRHNGHVTILK